MVMAPDKSLTNTFFILIQFFLNSLSMFPDYFGFEGTQLFKGEIFHQHWLENLKIKKKSIQMLFIINSYIYLPWDLQDTLLFYQNISTLSILDQDKLDYRLRQKKQYCPTYYLHNITWLSLYYWHCLLITWL